MKLLRLAVLLFVTASLASAQAIPSVKGKALDNSEVIIPETAGRQALILVVGFSHKSGDLCQVWDKKISSDYHSDARVGYFILPVLQSAPSFIRPMILHGMHKDVPAQELSHYVPIYAKEDEWKKLVNVSAPDDPFLIVATPEGHVVWQTHGSYSDETYSGLRKVVSAAIEK